MDDTDAGAGEALILHGVPVHVRHGRPPAEAVGIFGGRVAAAGTLAEVRAALPPLAVVRRLSHGAVLPAFVDPHQHAYLVAVDPHTDALHRRARDIGGLVAAVSALAALETAAGPADGWLRFHGYEPLALAERRSPTAAELDRAAGDRPLHVLSRTFHESVVSSAGLEALRISRGTPDPPGGRIVRDRRGMPTGVLLEAASFAAEAVSRGRGADAPEAWRERLLAHARRLLANGIVRIGDAAVPAAVAVPFVETLAEIGVVAKPLLIGGRIDEPAIVAGATAKVLLDGGEYCHLCMTGGQVRALMFASVRANLGPEREMARAVGTRAGWPHREPDGRWHTGIRYPQEAGFPAVLRRAADAGASLAVHAVGNGSVEALLDAREADPVAAAAVTLRIEHAIALGDGLARRIGGTGVPVVVQPGFLPTAGHELAIAPLPAPLRLMPFRLMREAGIPLAFSSDYPATPLSPWEAVWAAVTRLDATGAAILPDQAVELGDALDASTRVAAHVLGAGAGTLEPGMPADLIWCDRDPYAVPVASLRDITVLETWSGGRRVYARAGD